jgi:hypothetical protein
MKNNSQKYFVAYLDILGFKAMVSSGKNQKLETCFTICEQLIESWQKTDGKREFKVYNFSDSIVILVPASSNKEINIFKQLCIALADLQYNLAKNDIWIRGGVSYGEMEISESSINDIQKFLRMYGKPLIQAYEIESKIAKFPRVVIDPSLIESLGYTTSIEMIEDTNKDIDYANWRGDVLFLWPNRNSRLVQDVPMFIDYLEYLFHDFGHFESNKSDIFVEVLRRNINGNPSHYEKYRWVADYLITKAESKSQLKLGRDGIQYTLLLHRL